MKVDNIQVTQTKRVDAIKSNLERGSVGSQGLNKENLDGYKSGTKDFNKKELEQAVDLVNETLKVVDKKFDFQLHEGTNRTMVKVVNRETEEIIRKIPPEEILDLVEKMTELVGLMMDKRV